MAAKAVTDPFCGAGRAPASLTCFRAPAAGLSRASRKRRPPARPPTMAAVSTRRIRSPRPTASNPAASAARQLGRRESPLGSDQQRRRRRAAPCERRRAASAPAPPRTAPAGAAAAGRRQRRGERHGRVDHRHVGPPALPRRLAGDLLPARPPAHLGVRAGDRALRDDGDDPRDAQLGGLLDQEIHARPARHGAESVMRHGRRRRPPAAPRARSSVSVARRPGPPAPPPRRRRRRTASASSPGRARSTRADVAVLGPRSSVDRARRASRSPGHEAGRPRAHGRRSRSAAHSSSSRRASSASPAAAKAPQHRRRPGRPARPRG